MTYPLVGGADGTNAFTAGISHFPPGLNVPGGVTHCFRNTGDVPMKIMWVYASTSVTRTFADTGQTVEHLSGEDLIGR